MGVYVLILAGSILLFLSLISFVFKYKIYKRGIRVKGTIIDIKKIEEAILDEFHQMSTIVLYKPIIQFENEDGEEIVFIQDDTTNLPNIKISDEVSIVYNKKNRNEYYLDFKSEIFKIPIILGVLSSLIFVITFTIMII